MILCNGGRKCKYIYHTRNVRHDVTGHLCFCFGGKKMHKGAGINFKSSYICNFFIIQDNYKILLVLKIILKALSNGKLLE